MNRSLWLTLVSSLLAACVTVPAGRVTTSAPSDGRSDFDFLQGTWSVMNRRLKHRHVHSTEWEEFRARSQIRPVLGGLGNVDELDFPSKGWSGLTLRLFDVEKKTWSLYWVNSRDGQLQTPVVGRFANGVGEFFANDTDEGRAVRVRYRWSGMTPTSARWEQAFSLDDGQSWETNWVMEFTRERGDGR